MGFGPISCQILDPWLVHRIVLFLCNVTHWHSLVDEDEPLFRKREHVSVIRE